MEMGVDMEEVEAFVTQASSKVRQGRLGEARAMLSDP